VKLNKRQEMMLRRWLRYARDEGHAYAALVPTAQFPFFVVVSRANGDLGGFRQCITAHHPVIDHVFDLHRPINQQIVACRKKVIDAVR
jgi:hypothetical protein